MDRESVLETIGRLLMAELGLLDDGSAAVLAVRLIVVCYAILTTVSLVYLTARWHLE